MYIIPQLPSFVKQIFLPCKQPNRVLGMGLRKYGKRGEDVCATPKDKNFGPRGGTRGPVAVQFDVAMQQLDVAMQY